MLRVARPLVAVLLWLTAGCMSVQQPAASPVASRIYDVRASRYVDAQELEQRLLSARFRLLGEVHDNPAHHALRAQLLRMIAAAGKHPAVVFEQLDQPNDDAVRAAQRAGADSEALVRAGALDRAAWEWPLHKPLFDAALEAALPIRAGNVSRAALEPVARRNDVAALDPAWREVLDRAPWDAAKAQSLAAEIEESHCGKLPASAVPRLALAQRVRDAALAAALLRDANNDGAVLIAGNGHVRADLGVPLYLGASARRDVVSVAFLEVAADEREPDIARRIRDARDSFDFIWLTDAVYRPDPCASMPSV